MSRLYQSLVKSENLHLHIAKINKIVYNNIVCKNVFKMYVLKRSALYEKNLFRCLGLYKASG